jgi:hypothetical protein
MTAEADTRTDLVEAAIVGENGNVSVVSTGCDNIKSACVELGSARTAFS